MPVHIIMGFLEKYLQHPFIAGKKYDLVFFLLAPIVAALIGGTLYSTFEDHNYKFGTYALLYLGTFITNFHLVLVFYRSHNNSEIFKLYKFRFIAIPFILLASFFLLPSWFAFCVGLALVWDSYHSAMQVFGLARIYDQKMGNKAELGRRQDFIFNLVIHYCPMFIGITTLKDIYQLLAVESTINPIPKESLQNIFQYFDYLKVFAWVFLIGYTLYYVWFYRQLQKQGYKFSNNKVILYALILACRVYAFSFHFVSAWIILNIFHAMQYFGIVWFTEKSRIQNLFGASKAVSLFFFTLTAVFYALYVSGASDITGIKFSLTITLLHYWYDGFIWSVRKKQV